ncbi:unnamed protein product [Urochloa humidicola]
MEDAEENQKSGSNAPGSSASAASPQSDPSPNNGAATDSEKQVVEQATDNVVENFLQESSAKVVVEDDTSVQSELSGGVHTMQMNNNDLVYDGSDSIGETMLDSLPALSVSVDTNAAEIQIADVEFTEEDSFQGGFTVESELAVQGCGEGISQDEVEAVVEATQHETSPIASNKKFVDLPRHMLQALSKKNGIHANLSNVAMVKALQALDTVSGIEITTNAIDGNGELEKRFSNRASTMDDTNMIEKAMNLVAKKNSLNPGCLQGSILVAFLVPTTT